MTTLEEEKYLGDRPERIRNLFTSKYCTIRAMYHIFDDDLLRCEAMHIDRIVYGIIASMPEKYAEVMQVIARRIDREKREIFRASIFDIDRFKYTEGV